MHPLPLPNDRLLAQSVFSAEFCSDIGKVSGGADCEEVEDGEAPSYMTRSSASKEVVLPHSSRAMGQSPFRHVAHLHWTPWHVLTLDTCALLPGPGRKR